MPRLALAGEADPGMPCWRPQSSPPKKGVVDDGEGPAVGEPARCLLLMGRSKVIIHDFHELLGKHPGPAL